MAAFLWTMMGSTPSGWYLPITPRDAYFFDMFTFEEYRGRGLYPILMNYISRKMQTEGATRAVGEIFTWNNASLKVIEKTIWSKYGQARKVHILGKTLTIWSQ